MRGRRRFSLGAPWAGSITSELALKTNIPGAKRRGKAYESLSTKYEPDKFTREEMYATARSWADHADATVV